MPVLGGHRADKEIALPIGEEVARVEHHSRWRDRRHPVIDRLLDAFHARRAVSNGHVLPAIRLSRVVLLPVGDVGPSVVPPRPDDVDLVAALGAVINGPQLPCLRVNRGAFRILEAVRIGLAQDGRPGEPRVVLRDRAVAVDANGTPGEVAADVRIVGEIVTDAIEVASRRSGIDRRRGRTSCRPARARCCARRLRPGPRHPPACCCLRSVSRGPLARCQGPSSGARRMVSSRRARKSVRWATSREPHPSAERSR